MALNRDEIGLLLEAGGRDGGVGQDAGPLDTFEDEMVGLRWHNGGRIGGTSLSPLVNLGLALSSHLRNMAVSRRPLKESKIKKMLSIK